MDLSHLKALVIVSGVSGAGRSTVLAKLEDLNFFVVDNIPPSLIPALVTSLKARGTGLLLALSLSTESDSDVSGLGHQIKLLSEGGDSKKITVIFLDSDTFVILKRYSETRRPHPRFDGKIDVTLEDTITRERARLESIRFFAQLVIDTSSYSIHDLRREVGNFIHARLNLEQPKLKVNLLSFGFKYGVPLTADLIIDVRFLPNPYFQEALRPKTGMEREVYSFVIETPVFKTFAIKWLELLRFLLPLYREEGKAYLTIGIGCTGGKHRSVAGAIYFRDKLSDYQSSSSQEISLAAQHRDITRDS